MGTIFILVGPKREKSLNEFFLEIVNLRFLPKKQFAKGRTAFMSFDLCLTPFIAKKWS
jgi:hypothetical protein